MDIWNTLPSPHQIFRTALSLFNSFVLFHGKGQREKVSQADFDIDAEMGFLPRRPLPRLQAPFEAWETALCEAPEVLSLGEDDSEAATEKRSGGEAWRTNLTLVSGHGTCNRDSI
jgi:hypothetical protein